MAEDLDDGEFWLPSQFLTDDDILMDFTRDPKGPNKGLYFGFDGFGIGCGPSPGSSSPGESVTGSTAGESDDEEQLLAGLTQKMARSSIDDWVSSKDGWGLSRSPQSTLSAMGDGCGCKRGGGYSSSGQVSPPLLQASLKGDWDENDAVAWDLLRKAAGEVAKMRVKTAEVHGTGFFDSSRVPLYQQQQPIKPKPTPNFHSAIHPPPGSLSQQKLQQISEFQRLVQKQQQNHALDWGPGQSGKGQFPPIGHGYNGILRSVAGQRPLGLSPAAWPLLRRPENDMQAMFKKPETRRESVGTGVFFPRPVNFNSELFKKAGTL